MAHLQAEGALSGLYASSTAPLAWRLVAGIGPLTRAELARGLGVTKRTASQSVAAMVTASMVSLRTSDGAIVPTDT